MSDGFLTDRERAEAQAHAARSVRAGVRAQRRPWWREPPAWIALVSLVVAIAAVALWIASKNTAISEKDDTISAQGKAISALQQQVRGLGATPVAGPKGATGAQGPGPTAQQISDAVTLYCSVHDGCAGIPSRAQVAAAVRAYCAAGACKGKAGKAGKTGATGAAPSSSTVADAVIAYCAAHNQCAGPPGPAGPSGAVGASGAPGHDGASGAPGTDGRGITSIDCTGLGVSKLTIHYSDGTTQEVPCTP